MPVCLDWRTVYESFHSKTGVDYIMCEICIELICVTWEVSGVTTYQCGGAHIALILIKQSLGKSAR